MRLETKFTSILQNTTDRIRRFTHSSSRERIPALTANIKRELYGMNMREQLAAKQVLSQAGQTVAVRQSTIAFGKDCVFRFLEKGSHVKLSKHPLQLDENGTVEVVLHEHSNKYMFLPLSDYLAAIGSGE
jgi:hypothetical protein